ncbi:growth inhibitor PemK [Candidatus Pacearchaeota archaeon CG1_02_32_132]|nr:MAG: growth inhibitor PemK [Candidatus Pacearchaeota archaeon CG1_02_32_132]
MEGFVRGEVVVLEFPFSNFIKSKKRPVLVIKVPKGEDIIVCQITGKSYDKLVEIPIKKEDFAKGKLKVESYLRIDKIFSAERSLVKYKIGALKSIKIEEVVNKIVSFLKE